jgi:hypothetical protein
LQITPAAIEALLADLLLPDAEAKELDELAKAQQVHARFRQQIIEVADAITLLTTPAGEVDVGVDGEEEDGSVGDGEEVDAEEDDADDVEVDAQLDPDDDDDYDDGDANSYKFDSSKGRHQ